MPIRFVLISFLLVSCTALTNAQTRDSVPTVKIGWQFWMMNNLDVDHFANGDLIPIAKNVLQWKEAADKGTPAWCYYNNDAANGSKYGKLYNWWAVNDKRGLTPKGWHVPTNFEWNLMVDYLGGETVAGSKLKNDAGWSNLKDGTKGSGTNSSGFAGLPGGTRVNNGTFNLVGKIGGWWTSTPEDDAVAWLHFFYNEDDRDHIDSNVKGCGYSVRCIKDY